MNWTYYIVVNIQILNLFHDLDTLRSERLAHQTRDLFHKIVYLYIM